MSNAFAVEVDRKVVGIAVRAPGGFRFVASEPRFFAFEGKIFRKGRSIGRRLAELARLRREKRNERSRPQTSH